MEQLLAGLVLAGVLGLAVTIGGWLMLRRKVIGLRLLVIASTLFIAISLQNAVFEENSVACFMAAMRAAWWIFVLVLALKQNSTQGKSWWKSTT